MDTSIPRATETFRIKVQRITKPKIVPAEIKSLSFPFSVQPEEKSLNDTFIPSYLSNCYFQLNPEFGKMYVGETLRTVISIINTSNYVIEAANIHVEMATESKSQADTGNMMMSRDVRDSVHLKNITQSSIRPQETIVFPLEYHVLEADTYYLSFNIVYKHEVYTQTNQGVKIEMVEKTQNKRFRFDAKLPYNLKQRAYRDRQTGKVLVEIGLENTSKNTLFFKEITFLCAEGYDLVPLPANEEEDLSKLCLNVGEGHHFIYSLQPRKGLDINSVQNRKDILEKLGQLYTEWYNITNETGKAHSQIITISIPQLELSVSLNDQVTQLIKEIIFPAEILIKNETGVPVDLIFSLTEKEMTGVKVISLSKNEIKLGPQQTGSVVLFLLPIRLGIYKLGGLKIYNRLTQKELGFNELPSIIIIGEDDNVKAQNVQHLNYEESLI